MKRFLGYVITIVVGLLIGAGAMYYLITVHPLGGNTKIEKTVTVTDNGISDGIANIYDSVVIVENYQKGKLMGIGSGFVYDEKGYIMTNHHVVEKASELKVILMSGESIDAKIIGSDEYADIAVIQIDSKKVPAVAKIGSSEQAKVGDTVFTIGSPMSHIYAGTVTRGILSGKNRMVEVSVKSTTTNDWIMKVMQTDAAINPGNSGGPLCNVNGEVIGINSMKIVEDEVEGIGFAIPIEDALYYTERMVKGESIKRAILGVEIMDISGSYYQLLREGITLDESITKGAVVYNIITGGPAQKAGIEKGDVIVKISNYDITSVAELKYYLYKHQPGETVDVKVIRGKSEKTIKVTLGEN